MVSTTFCARDFAGMTTGIPLPVDFEFLSIGDLYASQLLVGGTEFINLVRDVDYEVVDLGGGAAEVNPLTDLASDITVRIFRMTSPVQPYTFPEGGSFPPESVEAMGDRLCFIEQETRLLAGIDSAAVQTPDGVQLVLITAVFTNSTDRGNATPAFLGQLGVQLDTGVIYRGTALSGGAWTSAAGGDIAGPGSSTDNAVPRFDGTTGKILQDSLLIVDDTGNVTGIVALTLSGVLAGTDATNSSDATGTTGAVKTLGGLSVAKDAWAANFFLKSTGSLATDTFGVFRMTAVKKFRFGDTGESTGALLDVTGGGFSLRTFNDAAAAALTCGLINAELSVTTGTGISVPTGHYFAWNGSTVLKDVANGRLRVTNSGENSGFCLDGDSGTFDDTCEVKTRGGAVGGKLIVGLQGRDQNAPTIASAGTIAPVTPVIIVSGTAAISTITPPAPILTRGGRISIRPSGIFTWDTAGNIAIAGTAVVNRLLEMEYFPADSKWVPSYI